MTRALKLPFSWSARFDDSRHLVRLQKRVNGSSGVMYRKIRVVYKPPFLQRVDQHGQPQQALCEQLPPQTTAALLRACRERWDA